MKTLKPCPFCRATDGKLYPEWNKSGAYGVIVCRACGATGPPGRTDAETFENWNKRAERAEGDRG